MRTNISSRIPFLVIFLYACSLIKFFDRNPLSIHVGFEGPLELSVLAVAAVTFFAFVHKRKQNLIVPPSAKAFLLFGVIAMASSVFSFYPLLSFAKGVSFVLVCVVAILASNAIGTTKIVQYLYHSVVVVLAVDLVVKLAGGGPLLQIDNYSGRAHLSLFGLHPTLLGELTAVTLLSSFVLPRKPWLGYQVFLLAMNIASDSRASTISLGVILCAVWLASVWHRPRFVVFLCCALGSLLALFLYVGAQTNGRPSADIASVLQPIYGKTFVRDIPNLDGRTNVWDAAAPAVAHCTFLGYGLGGARNVLVDNSSWTWVAGDAHNSLINLILGGGMPAVVVLLFGWAGAARRAWRVQGSLRMAAMGVFVFIAAFGIVAPNLTNLQGVSTLLIVTIDFMLCEKLAITRAECLQHAEAPSVEKFLENPAST